MNSKSKKLLIFDLDETIIRSEIIKNGIIDIYDFDIKVGDEHYGVKLRKGTIKLFNNLKKKFDLAIYTAGTESYATPIIDYI